MGRKPTSAKVGFLPRLLSQYIFVTMQSCEVILILLLSFPWLNLSYPTRILYILLSFPQLIAISICSNTLQRLKRHNPCDYCFRGFYLLPSNPRFSCSCRSMHIQLLRRYNLFMVCHSVFLHLVVLSTASVDELLTLYIIFVFHSIFHLLIVSVSPLTAVQRCVYSILSLFLILFYLGLFTSPISLAIYVISILFLSSTLHSIIQRIDSCTEVIEYTTFNHGFLRLIISIFQTLAPPEFLYRMIPSYSRQSYKYKLSSRRQEFLQTYTLEEMLHTGSFSCDEDTSSLCPRAAQWSEAKKLTRDVKMTKSSPIFPPHLGDSLDCMNSSVFKSLWNNASFEHPPKESELNSQRAGMTPKLFDVMSSHKVAAAPKKNEIFHFLGPFLESIRGKPNFAAQELSVFRITTPIYRVCTHSDIILNPNKDTILDPSLLRKRNPVVKYEVDTHIHERYILLCAIHIQRPVMSMFNAKTVHTLPDELNYLALINLLFSIFDYILANFFNTQACIHKLKTDDKTYFAYVDLSLHVSMMYKEKLEPAGSVDKSTVSSYITQSKGACLQTILTFASLASYFGTSIGLECNSVILYTRTVLGFLGSGHYIFDMVNPGINLLQGLFSNYYEVFQDSSLLLDPSVYTDRATKAAKKIHGVEDGRAKKGGKYKSGSNTHTAGNESLGHTTPFVARISMPTKSSSSSKDTLKGNIHHNNKHTAGKTNFPLPPPLPRNASKARSRRSRVPGNDDSSKLVIMDNRIFFINQVNGYNDIFSTRDFFTDMPEDIFLAELIDTDEFLSVLQLYTKSRSPHHDIYDILPPCYNLLPVAYSIRCSSRVTLTRPRTDINYEYCRFFEVVSRPEIVYLLLKLLNYSLTHDIKTTQPYPVEEVLNPDNFDVLCANNRMTCYANIALHISQDPMLLNFVSLKSYLLTMADAALSYSNKTRDPPVTFDQIMSCPRGTMFLRLFSTPPQGLFLPDVLLPKVPCPSPDMFITLASTGFLPPYLRTAVKTVIMSGLKGPLPKQEKMRSAIGSRQSTSFCGTSEEESCSDAYEDIRGHGPGILKLRLSSDYSMHRGNYLKDMALDQSSSLHGKLPRPVSSEKEGVSLPPTEIRHNKSIIPLSQLQTFALNSYRVGAFSRIRHFKIISSAGSSMWYGDDRSDTLHDSTRTLISSDPLVEVHAYNTNDGMELTHFQGTCYSTMSRNISTFDDILKKFSEFYNPQHIHTLKLSHTSDDCSMFYGARGNVGGEGASTLNLSLEKYYRDVLKARTIPKEILAHYREELYDDLLLLFPEAYDIIPKGTFMVHYKTATNYHPHHFRIARQRQEDESSKNGESTSQSIKSQVRLDSGVYSFISDPFGGPLEEYSGVAVDTNDFHSHDHLSGDATKTLRKQNLRIHSESRVPPTAQESVLHIHTSSSKVNLMKDIPYSATIADLSTAKLKLYDPLPIPIVKSAGQFRLCKSYSRLPIMSRNNSQTNNSKVSRTKPILNLQDQLNTSLSRVDVLGQDISFSEFSLYGSLQTSEVYSNKSQTSDSDKHEQHEPGLATRQYSFSGYISRSVITSSSRDVQVDIDETKSRKFCSNVDLPANVVDGIIQTPSLPPRTDVLAELASSQKSPSAHVAKSAYASSLFIGPEARRSSQLNETLSEPISDIVRDIISNPDSIIKGDLLSSSSLSTTLSSSSSAGHLTNRYTTESKPDVDSQTSLRGLILANHNRMNSTGSNLRNNTEATNLYILSNSTLNNLSFSSNKLSFSSDSYSSTKSYSTSIESDDDITNVVTIVDPADSCVELEAVDLVHVSSRESDISAMRNSNSERLHPSHDGCQLAEQHLATQNAPSMWRLGRHFKSSFELSGCSAETSSDVNTTRSTSLDLGHRSYENLTDHHLATGGTSSTLYNVFKNSDDKFSMKTFFLNFVDRITYRLKQRFRFLRRTDSRQLSMNETPREGTTQLGLIKNSSDYSECPLLHTPRNPVESRKLTNSSIIVSIPYLNSLFDRLQRSFLLCSTFSFTLLRNIKHCGLLFRLMVPSFCMPGVLIQANLLSLVLFLFSVSTDINNDTQLEVWLTSRMPVVPVQLHTIRGLIRQRMIYIMTAVVESLSGLMEYLSQSITSKILNKGFTYAHSKLQDIFISLSVRLKCSNATLNLYQFLSGQSMPYSLLKRLYVILFFPTVYTILLYLNKHIKDCQLRHRVAKVEIYMYSAMLFLNLYCLEVFSNGQILRTARIFRLIEQCQTELSTRDAAGSAALHTMFEQLCSANISALHGLFMKGFLNLMLTLIATVIYWFVLSSAMTIPPLLLTINGMVISICAVTMKLLIVKEVPYAIVCHLCLAAIVFFHVRPFLTSYILILKAKVGILLNWCQSQKMFKLLISDRVFLLLMQSIKMHENLSILLDRNNKINLEMAKNMGLRCHIFSDDAITNYAMNTHMTMTRKRYKQHVVNNCGFFVQSGTFFTNNIVDSTAFMLGDFFSEQQPTQFYMQNFLWEMTKVFVDRSVVQPLRLYLYNISLLLGIRWPMYRRARPLTFTLNENEDSAVLTKQSNRKQVVLDKALQLRKNMRKVDTVEAPSTEPWIGSNSAYFYDSSLRTPLKHGLHSPSSPKSPHSPHGLVKHPLTSSTTFTHMHTHCKGTNKTGATADMLKSALLASEEFVRGYTSYNDNRRLGLKRYADVSFNKICIALSFSDLFLAVGPSIRPSPLSPMCSDTKNSEPVTESGNYRVQTNEAFYTSSIQFQLSKEFTNMLTAYLAQFGKHMVIASSSFYKIEICIDCSAVALNENNFNRVLAYLNGNQLKLKSLFISARTMLPMAMKTLNSKYFKRIHLYGTSGEPLPAVTFAPKPRNRNGSKNAAVAPLDGHAANKAHKLPAAAVSPILASQEGSFNDSDEIYHDLRYTKEDFRTALAICDALALCECIQTYFSRRVKQLLPQASVSIGVAHGLCIETILGNYGRNFCIYGAALNKARYIATSAAPGTTGVSDIVASMHTRIKMTLAKVIEAKGITLAKLREDLTDSSQTIADRVSLQSLLATQSQTCVKENYGYSVIYESKY